MTGLPLRDPFWWVLLFLCAVSTYFRFSRRRERREKRYAPPSIFANLSPVSSDIKCPRCHTLWPSGYEPRSHRELMWTGVVCPNCGCEYDQRGHERKE
jgi:hypothetical protein